MKKQYRIYIASLLATAALLLGACQPKSTPAVSGSVPSADQVAIQYQSSGRGEPALVLSGLALHQWGGLIARVIPIRVGPRGQQ